MNHRNSYKKHNSNENDFISKLPDLLLVQILSFLPMKDAAKTSVLSTRWEYLWISIPSLRFYLEEDGEDVMQFEHFVDRFMSLRESRIKQLSLKCDQLPIEVDETSVRRWITSAVRYNVEELNIRFYDLPAFGLPRCVFACSSLVKLSLAHFNNFEFPPSTFLSSLKHLKLKHTAFKGAESTKNFLSGFPVLETLRLFQCYWTKVSSVCLCAPKLRKLEVREEELEDLENDSCNVLIYGPSLECFHYQGKFFNGYCLCDVPSLNEGKIEYFMTFRSVEEWDGEIPTIVSSRAYKLLKGLSNVKRLVLSSGFVEVLSCERDLVAEVPLFNRLSILSFCDIWEVVIECESLNEILQNSPCLETLCFHGGILYTDGEKQEILEPVPPCFLSSLKRLEMRYGNSCEKQKLFVDAAEILLNRAAILERLDICLLDKYSYGAESEEHPMDKEKLMKELIELPRASKVCQIDFVPTENKFW